MDIISFSIFHRLRYLKVIICFYVKKLNDETVENLSFAIMEQLTVRLAGDQGHYTMAVVNLRIFFHCRKFQFSPEFSSAFYVCL